MKKKIIPFLIIVLALYIAYSFGYEVGYGVGYRVGANFDEIIFQNTDSEKYHFFDEDDIK